MPLNLSIAAARRINQIVVADTGGAVGVRLEILGGGCSGFQYKFGFATAIDPVEDIVIERDGARLVVDRTSLALMDGGEVDYAEGLMEAGFKVNNPKAASSCGCGSSFSVKE